MVVAKYSLETEGANLSALPERAFESEKLICDMWDEKEAKNNRNRQRQKHMLTHQRNLFVSMSSIESSSLDMDDPFPVIHIEDDQNEKEVEGIDSSS